MKYEYDFPSIINHDLGKLHESDNAVTSNETEILGSKWTFVVKELKTTITWPNMEFFQNFFPLRPFQEIFCRNKGFEKSKKAGTKFSKDLMD